ncbi:MAG: hypothetical protein SGJ00_02485 [bacterium]|nr:hypothetical protein [bacterium]
MKKELFWKILVLILLLVNIATLGFIVWDKPRGNRESQRPDKLIIEGLNLDEAQVKEFQLLKRSHRNGMDSLIELEKELRKQLFVEIKNGLRNDSVQTKYLVELSLIRNQKDKITLLHFKDIYNLCREDQKGLYEETIGEISQKLLHDGRPKNHKRP